MKLYCDCSQRYLEQLEDLIFNEDVLLQTLGFDLAVEHPHTHIISCSHLIRGRSQAHSCFFSTEVPIDI